VAAQTAADDAAPDQANQAQADRAQADRAQADQAQTDEAHADRAQANRAQPRKKPTSRASGQKGKAADAEASGQQRGEPSDGPSAEDVPARAASAPPPPLVIFQPPEILSASATAGQTARQSTARQGTARDGDEASAGEAGRDEASASKRKRRGGRGRGKGRETGAEGSETEAPAAAAAEQAGRADGAAGPDGARDSGKDGAKETAQDDGQDEAAGEPGTSSGKRRRRRRRSGSGGDADQAAAGASADDPPNTVVHVRTPRPAAEDDVRAVKGSTRLEAKRQRRREGRESGRRRPPIITESEFLARREAVERVMVVRQRGDRTQIAVLEDGVLVEHYVDKASHQSYVGNVYLGKVQNVLPSMEAAFVDIGKGRNAVLYAGEVNFDASGLEGESKRIESALKSGQSVVVQVTKDPIGHKGARLTSQISLPGRYLVYVPGASMTGISRKLPDTERNRLKQILKQVMPEHAGVIVRTAAEGASEEELSRDVARLSAQWEAIERKAKTASAPELLYSEPDLTLRVVRDIFNEDFSSLVVASDTEWDLVDEYVRYVAPHLADRMQQWTEDKDVFAAYRIDEQLAKALERKVWLPSGGSLVIDHTEAMTVIDVNTGKFTGQGGNLEQTVTRNNLEAAEEIVRQLRLRDTGGIIVIDFIDMVLESNRELVLRRLLECLARDRTKHQVAEVTSLGLVQMTRKRVGSGLLEAFSVPCEHCNGRGVIISLEPVDHSAHGHARGAAKAEVAPKGAAAASDVSAGNGPASRNGRPDGSGDGAKPSRSRGRRSSRPAGAPTASVDEPAAAPDEQNAAAPEEQNAAAPQEQNATAPQEQNAAAQEQNAAAQEQAESAPAAPETPEVTSAEVASS
jgi:ribonuclease E